MPKKNETVLEFVMCSPSFELLKKLLGRLRSSLFFRIFLWIFIALLTAVLLSSDQRTKKLFQDSISPIEPFFTILGILVALLVWRNDKERKDAEHHGKQTQLLETINEQANYIISDQIIKVNGRDELFGDVPKARQAVQTMVTENSYPAQLVLEIDANFYTKELDTTINGKSTLEIKKKLYFLMKMANSFNYWVRKTYDEHATNSKIAETRQPAFLQQLNEIEQIAVELQNEVNAVMKKQ